MLKPTLTALLALFPLTIFAQGSRSADSRSFAHKTTLSLFNNYNRGEYYFSHKTGLITTPEKAHNNIGFSVTEDIYVLPHELYLSTGVRLNTSESFIDVRTLLPDFAFNLTFFKFRVRHWQVTAPVHVGKTIQFKRNKYRHLDIYAGPSFGITQAIYEKQENQGMKSIDDQKFVALSNVGFKDDLGRAKFLATIDAGFRFAPFNFPNLSVGVTASYNLNKTREMNEVGSFHTETDAEYFNLDFSRRYFNLMFQVNYSFGKKWKKQFSASKD